MHMCASVSEEGGDEEGADSEEVSLLSYTLEYLSLGYRDTCIGIWLSYEYGYLFIMNQ
jgi:hypothetical protein